MIYRCELIPGRKRQFEEGWRAGTAAITKELAGRGSPLHRGDDGTVFAYAQWPDRATWERAMATRMHHSDEAARAKYRGAFEPDSFETMLAGEVIADLLELRRGEA